MRSPVILLCLGLVGCPSGTELDDDDAVDPTPEPVPITASLRTLDAFVGAVRADVRVFEGGLDDTPQTSTDDEGRVELTLTAAESFRVGFEVNGYAPHHLVGVAGNEDFAFTTLLGSRGAQEQVYTALGVTVNDERGTVVVDLHAADGVSPAVGGSVSLDAEHDTAFIFVNNGPRPGSELVPGANTFVTFPNVLPGDFEVFPEGPDGTTCRVGPARSDELDRTTWRVGADTVLVIDYVCE